MQTLQKLQEIHGMRNSADRKHIKVKTKPPWKTRYSLVSGLTLEAAHHQWLRSILRSHGEIVTNEEVRRRTEQTTLEKVLRESWMWWLGHVVKMEEECIPKQALYWEVEDFKWRPGRPMTNWRDIVKKDLPRVGLTREEVETSAQDKSGVASCVVCSIYNWCATKFNFTSPQHRSNLTSHVGCNASVTSHTLPKA